MNAAEQFSFDVQVAALLQQRQTMSDGQLAADALAELLLFCGGGSKYGLSVPAAATYVELRHRSQPSSAF
jgi:hypothetical protein